MDRIDRLAPYTRPPTADEANIVLWHLMAKAALAQARLEVGSEEDVPSDEKLDEVLARVTPQAVERVSSVIGRAAAAAVRGDLLPSGDYTDEELEL